MKGLFNVLFFVVAMFFASNFLFAAGNSDGKKEITIGLDAVVGSIPYQAMQKFGEHITESRADIEFVLYPANQLGDHRAMTAQLRAGELDIQQLAFPNLNYFIPELTLVAQPYVAEDIEQMRRIMSGPYGQKMSQKMEELGMKMLAIAYFGSREITSNTPIESIDDMVGLTIRVPDVDFLIDFATAIGATPAPLSFHELYLALQTNQVDAQENPLPTIYTMKFYEVQDYIAMTNHYMSSQSIFINLDLWNSLTAEDQALFQEAADLSVDFQTEEVRRQEKEMVELLEEKGVTFTYPDPKPFREAMKPHYAKLEEEFGAGSISDLMNY